MSPELHLTLEPVAWDRTAENVEFQVGNSRHLRCTYCGMEEVAHESTRGVQLVDWRDRFVEVHAHPPRGMTSTSAALHALAEEMRWAVNQLEVNDGKLNPYHVLSVYRAAIDQIYRMALRIDAQAEKVADEVGIR
jgi:hypothetical protein